MLCYAMVVSLIVVFVMVVFAVAVFNIILTFDFIIIFIRRQDISILHCLKLLWMAQSPSHNKKYIFSCLTKFRKTGFQQKCPGDTVLELKRVDIIGTQKNTDITTYIFNRPRDSLKYLTFGHSNSGVKYGKEHHPQHKAES